MSFNNPLKKKTPKTESTAVKSSEYEKFKETGEASDEVLDAIARKMTNGKKSTDTSPLSEQELAIYEKNATHIEKKFNTLKSAGDTGTYGEKKHELGKAINKLTARTERLGAKHEKVRESMKGKETAKTPEQSAQEKAKEAFEAAEKNFFKIKSDFIKQKGAAGNWGAMFKLDWSGMSPEVKEARKAYEAASHSLVQSEEALFVKSKLDTKTDAEYEDLFFKQRSGIKDAEGKTVAFPERTTAEFKAGLEAFKNDYRQRKTEQYIGLFANRTIIHGSAVAERKVAFEAFGAREKGWMDKVHGKYQKMPKWAKTIIGTSTTLAVGAGMGIATGGVSLGLLGVAAGKTGLRTLVGKHKWFKGSKASLATGAGMGTLHGVTGVVAGGGGAIGGVIGSWVGKKFARMYGEGARTKATKEIESSESGLKKKSANAVELGREQKRMLGLLNSQEKIAAKEQIAKTALSMGGAVVGGTLGGGVALGGLHLGQEEIAHLTALAAVSEPVHDALQHSGLAGGPGIPYDPVHHTEMLPAHGPVTDTNEVMVPTGPVALTDPHAFLHPPTPAAVQGPEQAVETGHASGSEAATATQPYESITAQVGNGEGSIKMFEHLKHQLEERYPDHEHAPLVVKHILEGDPTKLAQEYNFYKPESDIGSGDGLESALVQRGSTLDINEHGELVFNQGNGGESLMLANDPSMAPSGPDDYAISYETHKFGDYPADRYLDSNHSIHHAGAGENHEARTEDSASQPHETAAPPASEVAHHVNDRHAELGHGAEYHFIPDPNEHTPPAVPNHWNDLGHNADHRFSAPGHEGGPVIESPAKIPDIIALASTHSPESAHEVAMYILHHQGGDPAVYAALSKAAENLPIDAAASTALIEGHVTEPHLYLQHDGHYVVHGGGVVTGPESEHVQEARNALAVQAAKETGQPVLVPYTDGHEGYDIVYPNGASETIVTGFNQHLKHPSLDDLSSKNVVLEVPVTHHDVVPAAPVSNDRHAELGRGADHRFNAPATATAAAAPKVEVSDANIAHHVQSSSAETTKIPYANIPAPHEDYSPKPGVAINGGAHEWTAKSGHSWSDDKYVYGVAKYGSWKSGSLQNSIANQDAEAEVVRGWLQPTTETHSVDANGRNVTEKFYSNEFGLLNNNLAPETIDHWQDPETGAMYALARIPKEGIHPYSSTEAAHQAILGTPEPTAHTQKNNDENIAHHVPSGTVKTPKK